MQRLIHQEDKRPWIGRAAVAFLVTALGAGCSSDSPNAIEPLMSNHGALPVASVDDADGIVVTNSVELVAAMTPANAGRRILVRAGTYNITQPLFVPDSATVQGEGVMLFDAAGLPTGFQSGTNTAIIMTANVAGDVLTLGNGSALKRIAIADMTGRAGNVVAVLSRGASDQISSTVQQVVITNPNTHAIIPAGPSGCGIAVVTQNPNLGNSPAPHEGSQLSARVSNSLVISPSTGTGCGVFAFNFAALSNVSVNLSENVIGGGIIANGGVSRPESVHDSKTVIQSRRNLYRDDSPSPCTSRHLAWNMNGGSGSPAPLQVGETSRNTLEVHSLDDRIEGFTFGISAAGGRRFFALPTAGATIGNRADIELIGTRFSTASCGGASFVYDLRLAGAGVTNPALVVEGNILSVVMRGVTGSGTRANLYGDLVGPTGALPAGASGNRLEFPGTLRAFSNTNQDVDPAPGAEFFTSGK